MKEDHAQFAASVDAIATQMALSTRNRLRKQLSQEVKLARQQSDCLGKQIKALKKRKKKMKKKEGKRAKTCAPSLPQDSSDTTMSELNNNLRNLPAPLLS